MANIHIDYTMLQNAKNGDTYAIQGVINLLFLHTVGLDIEERQEINTQINDWYEKLMQADSDSKHILNYANFLRYEMKDLQKSFELKNMIAELNADAMDSLGSDYYEGIPGFLAPDAAMARECWSKAESKRAVDALLNDTEDKLTNPEVYHYFDMADLGYSFAYDEIKKATGVDYQQLSSNDRLLLQKNVYMTAATEHHMLDAAHRLYLLLWYKIRLTPGFSPEDSAAEAFYWVSHAANSGYVASMRALSSIYKEGIEGLVEPSEYMEGAYMRRIEEKLAFCKSASTQISWECSIDANLGDAEAKRKMAICFGKPYDYLNPSERGYLSYYHLLQDAENGDLEKQERLASTLIRMQEIDEGIYWRTKAAEAGYEDSIRELIRNYEEGILWVFPIDKEKALKYKGETPPPSPSYFESFPSTSLEVEDEPVIAPTKKKGFFNNLFGK